MTNNKGKKEYASLRNDGIRILAEGESTSNNTWETRRNNNDLIIGPTGAGKTRYYVKPNLLSASESLIVTDTKGSLRKELTPALEEAGYEVLQLDLTNPKESIGYLYYFYGVWGDFNLERIKTSGKDKKILAEFSTNEDSDNFGYAIKGKKIYYSWQSASGKNRYKQMKLNGKSKKNASTLAKNKYKASSAKGYDLIWKEGTSTSKIYLKTPKKKIFLVKVYE